MYAAGSTAMGQHPQWTLSGKNEERRRACPLLRLQLSKNKFFDRVTSGLHASLRSTLARIKVFFPPYMPPEKM